MTSAAPIHDNARATPARHDESASRPRPIAIAFIAPVWLARYEVQRRWPGLGLAGGAAPEVVVGWELATGVSVGWFYFMVAHHDAPTSDVHRLDGSLRTETVEARQVLFLKRDDHDKNAASRSY